VIAPATANTIAKIAHGFADNLLTSTVLDYKGPVFLFPAMHENMWFNPATQKNIKELLDRKVYVFDPEEGDLAGGKKGTGRMIEPDNILSKVSAILEKDFPAITGK
jgi:phosphopantothenoylcysteine decarboxylase/phosphopantothenate--cysteine ligase